MCFFFIFRYSFDHSAETNLHLSVLMQYDTPQSYLISSAGLDKGNTAPFLEKQIICNRECLTLPRLPMAHMKNINLIITLLLTGIIVKTLILIRAVLCD